MQIKQHKQVKYTEIDKDLTQILETVSAKRPLLEYEAESSINDAILISVSVWQHGQKLGVINARYKRYMPSKQQNEIWCAVSSPLIEKQRGRTNTKFCKSSATAAKIVIDVFAKQPLAVLGTSLGEKMYGLVEATSNRCASMFLDSFRNNTLAAATYFTELHLGNSPPMPPQIQKIMTEHLLKQYDNYRISENVRYYLGKKNGHAIKYMQDGSLLVVDMSDYSKTHKYESTYNLPQFMQEKLTMLKVLERNQFAENIGIKFADVEDSIESDCYFVVNGETVVN